MHAAVEARPTQHSQAILQIVDRIYAAAVGEARWEDAVAETCRLGRMAAGALTKIDPMRRPVLLATYGLRSAAEPETTPRPLARNPLLTEGVLQSAAGAVWQDHQIMSPALLATTSFWIDWMQPHGFASWACVIVGRDERHVVCLETYAGRGRASSSPELAYLLGQLAPHLTRAWRCGEMQRSSMATCSCRATSRGSSDTPQARLAGLPEVARLRAEFGLTKAEARLALRLAQGSSLASAAQTFDVKLTTIRSQLQQVFAKTGTSRQAELVALLLSRGLGLHNPRSGQLASPADELVAGK